MLDLIILIDKLVVDVNGFFNLYGDCSSVNIRSKNTNFIFMSLFQNK